jgi:hypothetical protein
MIAQMNKEISTQMGFPQFKIYDQSEKLGDIYATFKGDEPLDIPWIVRLMENPKSILPFPGKIDLYRHDCLHILLNLRFSLYEEAFVVGFTIGNDIKTKPYHCLIFKFISQYFYPQTCRFNQQHLKWFDLGFLYGRKIKTKNINNLDFSILADQSISVIRRNLGINIQELKLLLQSLNENSEVKIPE